MKKCIICGSVGNKNIFFIGGRKLVKCNKCGLYYAVYNTKKDFVEFYNKIYEKNFNLKKVDESKKIIFLNVLKKISLNSKGNLLDVGSGDGYFLFLAKRFGWETYGIEISTAMSQLANERYKIKVINSILVKARFKENFFDVVTMFDVVDQLENPIEELQEINKILKPGGILFLRLRNSFYHVNLQIFLRKIFGNMVKKMFVIHEYSFSASKIKKLLQKMNFKEIEIKNSFFSFGDPYSSFKTEEVIINYLKIIFYYVCEIFYYITFKKLFFSPSLLISARK